MKNSLLPVLRFSLVFLLLPLAAGCGKKDGTADASAERTAVVGFVQTGAESDWRKAHTVSVMEEAAERGYELRFASGDAKQENQIKALNSSL